MTQTKIRPRKKTTAVTKAVRRVPAGIAPKAR